MILKGIYKALRGGDWENEFNLGQRGLTFSFAALLLYIPCGMLIAKAIVQFNSEGQGEPNYSGVIQTVSGMALTFPLLAWILSYVFQQRDTLQAWLIVRNWTGVLILVTFAAFAGLYLVGLMPFMIVYFAGMALYLTTLAVDIRLAGRVGGYNWTIAVFISILIAISSMMVLLTAASRSLGA